MTNGETISNRISSSSTATGTSPSLNEEEEEEEVITTRIVGGGGAAVVVVDGTSQRARLEALMRALSLNNLPRFARLMQGLDPRTMFDEVLAQRGLLQTQQRHHTLLQLYVVAQARAGRDLQADALDAIAAAVGGAAAMAADEAALCYGFVHHLPAPCLRRLMRHVPLVACVAANVKRYALQRGFAHVLQRLLELGDAEGGAARAAVRGAMPWGLHEALDAPEEDAGPARLASLRMLLGHGTEARAGRGEADGRSALAHALALAADNRPAGGPRVLWVLVRVGGARLAGGGGEAGAFSARGGYALWAWWRHNRTAARLLFGHSKRHEDVVGGYAPLRFRLPPAAARRAARAAAYAAYEARSRAAVARALARGGEEDQLRAPRAPASTRFFFSEPPSRDGGASS